MRGERVRLKHGSGDEVHLSKMQSRRIMKAHEKGSGVITQFTHQQIKYHKRHAEGIVSSLKSVAQKALPIAENIAGKVAEKVVMKSLGLGIKETKGKKGGSIVGKLGKIAEEVALPILTKVATVALLGLGVKKRGRKKKVVADAPETVAEVVAEVKKRGRKKKVPEPIIEKIADAVEEACPCILPKKSRKKRTKVQKEEFVESLHGEALFPAGHSSGGGYNETEQALVRRSKKLLDTVNT